MCRGFDIDIMYKKLFLADVTEACVYARPVIIKM